jgi:hypothetical protein
VLFAAKDAVALALTLDGRALDGRVRHECWTVSSSLDDVRRAVARKGVCFQRGIRASPTCACSSVHASVFSISLPRQKLRVTAITRKPKAKPMAPTPAPAAGPPLSGAKRRLEEKKLSVWPAD